MKPTIKVQNLKKYYVTYEKEQGIFGAIKSFFKRKKKIVKAVDNISFELQEGELVGFIGQNGAGKTTTLKCLAGILYPDEGKVDVLGFFPFDRKKEFLKKIAFVMGRRGFLYWDLPAIDSYLLYKEIYEIEETEFKQTLKELTEMLDFTKLLKQPVRNLSLGERMKAEIIASLIHKPKVLFLDEPTIGLDVVMQKTLREFIKEYNRRYRATILLTSHYMEDVESLCKRIIVIHKGKIYYDGDLLTLKEKYVKFKKIEMTVSDKIEEKDFEAFQGLKVKSFNPPRVVLEARKERVPGLVKQLLSKFKILDLSVSEPDIADIVRQFFLDQK